MSVSLDRWIAITVLALTGYASVAIAEEVKTSLVASDAGKIYFNSAEKDASYAHLYKHTAVFDSPIWGDLRFPPTNAEVDKVPVMVVMHGSSGVSKHMYDWVEFFNKMGVATFMVDSFTPRGIKSTIDDQSQLSFPATTVDGLMALKLLATHPRIDAGRIGIIGFSRGGQAAMVSGFEKLRAAVVQGPAKYAVHIPFYAGCMMYATTTGSPILMFAGTKDESAPIAVCRTNADYLKSQGANLKLVVYEGAHHGFDSDNARHIYFPRGQTGVKCNLRTDLDRLEAHIKGDEHAATAPEIRDYLKSCMSTGWQVAGDPDAYAKSRKEVKDFITQNFGLAGQ